MVNSNSPSQAYNGPHIKIDKFDGVTNVVSWIRKFNNLAMEFGWNQLMLIEFYLYKGTENWYNALPAVIRANWQLLEATFRDDFVDNELQIC